MRIAQCDIGVMAATWPKTTAWPNDLREHATYLSKYLSDALLCIEAAKEQPIPTPLVKITLRNPRTEETFSEPESKSELLKETFLPNPTRGGSPGHTKNSL